MSQHLLECFFLQPNETCKVCGQERHHEFEGGEGVNALQGGGRWGGGVNTN